MVSATVTEGTISWACAKANYTLYKVIKNILIDPVFKDLNTIHIVYNYMHEYMNMLVHSTMY